MPGLGVHRRRLAATRQAMLLHVSTWEQLCGHSTSIQESRLTSRTDCNGRTPCSGTPTSFPSCQRPACSHYLELARSCTYHTLRSYFDYTQYWVRSASPLP